ncbi:MAG: hypothetical protein IT165_25365 [Bryobacterales bacterium]|nr:hypothetical protein [Bryobacterales bacterium]
MNAMRNWKTTAAGLLNLALVVLTLLQDSGKATDPTTIGGIVTGIGLIFAKDGDKTGVEPKSKS